MAAMTQQGAEEVSPGSSLLISMAVGAVTSRLVGDVAPRPEKAQGRLLYPGQGGLALSGINRQSSGRV